jgi:hypothetical protein
VAPAPSALIGAAGDAQLGVDPLLAQARHFGSRGGEDPRIGAARLVDEHPWRLGVPCAAGRVGFAGDETGSKGE